MANVRTIAIGGADYYLPFADLLPALTQDQLSDLRQDVLSRGFIYPVVANADREILDGANRCSIYDELRDQIAPPKVEVVNAKDERQLALDLNLHRRHLGREQRQQLVVKLKSDGWSNSRISVAVGVDTATVHRDLNRSGCASAQPERRTEIECSTATNVAVEQPTGPCSGAQNYAPEPGWHSKFRPLAGSRVEGVDGKSQPATKPNQADLAARQERAREAHSQGKSVRTIAQELGVSVGTASADIKAPVVVSIRPAATKPVPMLPEVDPADPDAWMDMGAGKLQDAIVRFSGALSKRKVIAEGCPPGSCHLIDWAFVPTEDLELTRASIVAIQGDLKVFALDVETELSRRKAGRASVTHLRPVRKEA